MGMLSIGLIIVLSACSGGSTEEKIHNHLEESVSAEADFEAQQKDITDLEKQEQKIYGEIVDLSMDDFDKIKDLSQQALKSIDKRSKAMELEKASIDESKESFDKTDSLIDKIEEKEVKTKAEKLQSVMNDRFKAYDALYKSYSQSLKQEKDLYEMLQQEDLEQDELTEQITNINKSYDKVLDANDQFNKDTNEYNDFKKEFYQAADIDVTFDGETEKE
jgi:DNA repair exonuclease SbcCD ATPase subunit